MRKLTKILPAILVVVLCVQIIAPGTVAIGATPFVGNNVAKSAADGSPVVVQGDNMLVTENEETIVQDNLTTKTDEKLITPILGEVEEFRTENTKHYRHKDGTYTAAVYSEPIHYLNSSGEWQDIDNTLALNNSRKSVSGKATYTPKSSSLDIRIPQDFSGGQFLTIGKDGYIVGMRLKTSDTISMSATAEKIDLSSVKAEIDNNYGSIKTSDVDILASNSSSKLSIDEANKEEMKLENKVSAVNYKNIFDGADLQYVITPSKVKENIIVNKKQDTYVYKFELALNGLVPVQQDNGSINLYDNVEDEEAVFVIETPYMYDANEDTSFDVSMSLSGNILTVTANSEWINDENRAFPVIIDPTLSTNASTFYDATANKNTPIMNFDSYKFLYAGNGLLNLRRTYFKFNLPYLPDGSVVTNATLEIKQHDVDLGDESVKLLAFDLTESASWSESSITWNNQPLSKDKNGPRDNPDLKKLDYELFKVENDKGQIYSFNLTKAVKNWYEGATNNGIMITSTDEEKNSQTTLYSSDHNDAALHPAVRIEYTNNIGLEDYWTYETTDLGRSGSLYANPYNGAVTYVHSDLSMTGNLMPISISHIHNHNTDNIYNEIYSGMYVGKKYHLNIQEVLVYDEQISKYKHYDADGTLHYYYSAGNGSITHEYDPTKVLTSSSSGYVITDGQGNKKYFNSNGQLYKCVDNNGNELTITITNNKITSVTDAVGRVVTLNYNSSNQLQSITDPAGRSITYSYSSTGTYATLSKITYSDGKYTSFSYSSYNITRINVYDGSYTSLSYNYKSYRGRRVEKIKNYDKNSQFVNMLTFKFTEDNISGIASGNTLVSNYFAETEDENNKKSAKIYLFDPYGRAISVTNSAGQTQYEIYGENANTADFNKLKDSSELLTIATNLLKNHGFERGNTYWSALQTAANGSWGIIYDYEKSSRGYYCLKLELPDTTGVYEIDQDFAAKEGQTYTVSVDINIPEVLSLTGNNGVAIGFTYCVDGVWKTEASKWIGETNGWERFSHTFTLPTGTISNCHLFLKLAQAKGTAYFDNVQVEESGGARSYNLVENSDFSNVTNSNGVPAAASAYAWTKYNCQATDGVYFRDWGNRNFFEITGSTEHKKYIYQNVPVNARAGDTIIIGGKVAAFASGGTSNNRTFEIYAKLYDDKGYFIDEVKIEFDRAINQERQTKATSIILEKDCRNLTLYFNYHYQTGPLSIDDLFVYVGNFGEHYRYTNDGLTDYYYNDESEIIDYTYLDNNVTKITQVYDIADVNSVETNDEKVVTQYTYDDNHNVTSIINNIGTEIRCTYNANGQVISQTTVTKDENGKETKMVESFTYYQNGNYLKSYTDVSGLTTSYVYDNNVNGENITKGLLTSIRNADGYTTSYTYDPNTDEVLSTTGATATPVSSTTNFTYENYLPKTITRNGTTYAYEYDSQNRVTSSKVGNQILITNSYDDRDRLSQVTYANGGAYASVYDSRDRLVGDCWNGTQISEYNYNENDRLSKFVDNITDVSYQYEYAFYDLPFKVTGTDGTKTSCDYDMSGTLARLTFSDGDDIIYSGKYFTNEKGMPEDVVIDTLDNATMHYNYDDFGRVKSYSYGPVIRTFRYEDPIVNDGITATDKVIEIIDETKDGEVLQSYELESFFDGSLYYVSENVEGDYYDYFYDGLRRVIENYANGELYDYYYDAGGNLTEVTCNSLPLHTYTYANANWKDQLTAFDGKAITYDANGNPITYDGYTYTWQRGTQLANITGNGKSISYVYDSQGHRVQKTVNGVTTNYLYSGDLLMRQTDGTNTIDFQYDAGGSLVGFLYNGVPYYYLRNVLNDISGVVDGDGNVVAKYRYDAYGNTILATGTMAEINPIRYRGYYYDTETNWYYLETRYYNPEWCRFISPDCLFIAGDAITGSNMYAYCNNNPIKYIDGTGTAAEENIFVKVTRPIVDAVTIIGWSIPEKIGNRMINKVFGNRTDDFSQFSNSNSFLSNLIFDWVLCPFTMEFLYYADYIISPIVSFTTGKKDWRDRTYETDKGLQYILWPYTMAMGARLGAFFLEFFQDDDGNYITHEGQYQWQHKMGYNWLYDAFFSLGGPIKKLVYDFTVTRPNENPDDEEEIIYYAVWCWKGDYWNLGPGAEIGIYYQKDQKRAEHGFYDIDKNNLKVKTHMKVDYDGKVGLIQQTNWWITMFMPWKGQRINLDDLQVWQAVSFDIPVGKTDANSTPYILDYTVHDNLNLFTSFKESKWNNRISNGTETNLKWGPTPPTSAGWDYLNLDGSYYGNFQFYIKF